MIVAELIAALSKLPPDWPVMVNGYEHGYHDLTPEMIHPMLIDRDVNEKTYCGPHEARGDDYGGREATEPPISAIVLSRDDDEVDESQRALLPPAP